MPTFLHYLGLATLIYLCLGFAFGLAMTFLTVRAARRARKTAAFTLEESSYDV